MSNRQEDAYRLSSLYEQLLKQGKRCGALFGEVTDLEMQSYLDLLRQIGDLQGSCHKYIGDDLSDSDLDDLWFMFSISDTNPGSRIPSWWKDKSHQIALRLLLRLTRVEAELKMEKSK
jgi:hypothetical protein